MKTAKKKSQQRFEQLNRLVDVVLPSMPAGANSHRAALMVLYRHAVSAGFFRVSAGMLAKTLNIKDRQARYIMSDLRNWQLIEPFPKGDIKGVKAYRFTFKAYSEPQTGDAL